MLKSDPERQNSNDSDIFEKETAMCKKLHDEKGGCNWGKCEYCGVIPLLHKLYRGELLESPEQVESAKKDIFEA